MDARARDFHRFDEDDDAAFYSFPRRRVLRAGAPFVVSFSNRCFPDKAVALWRVADDLQHVEVVTGYFTDSAEPGRAWAAVETFEHAPRQGDPLYAVWARRTPGDSASRA